jgi:hypothetical protein
MLHYGVVQIDGRDVVLGHDSGRLGWGVGGWGKAMGR